MKNKQPTKCLRSNKANDNISLGKIGVGPNGERFISIKITAQEDTHKTLLRFDNISSISSPEISKLNRLGAHLISPQARREFLGKVQELGPQEPSFQVATRVGPFGDSFVLPDQVVSVSGKKAHVAFDDNLGDYLSWGRTGGTLEDWRGFEKLAKGNSRLILALGLAFVGPLRLAAPVEPFCVQLTSHGGTGKSVIGACASSVWGQRLLGGQPHSLCGGDTWKNSVANLERVLAARDFTFLSLNETHHIKPDILFDAIFLICESQGKGRYTEVGRWEWFVPMLSSSNDSVIELLNKAGKKLERASLDRLIDIPPPANGHGFFEQLHGASSVGEFSLRLKAIFDVNFGVVGRDYVLRILQELSNDREGLAQWIEARQEYFKRTARKHVSSHSDHERVISHFSTIYAALRLAGRYELFNLLKRNAKDALLKCLHDHLRVTDTAITKSIIQSPLEKLKVWVKGNKSSFVDLSKPLPENHDHKACIGYVYSEGGRTWYGIPAANVEIVVGGKAELMKLKQALDQAGHIKKNGGGKDGHRYSTKVKIGKKRLPLYSIDCSALE